MITSDITLSFEQVCLVTYKEAEDQSCLSTVESG